MENKISGFRINIFHLITLLLIFSFYLLIVISILSFPMAIDLSNFQLLYLTQVDVNNGILNINSSVFFLLSIVIFSLIIILGFIAQINRFNSINIIIVALSLIGTITGILSLFFFMLFPVFPSDYYRQINDFLFVCFIILIFLSLILFMIGDSLILLSNRHLFSYKDIFNYMYSFFAIIFVFLFSFLFFNKNNNLLTELLFLTILIGYSLTKIFLFDELDQR